MVDRLRRMRLPPNAQIPLLQKLLHFTRRVCFLQRGIHSDFEIWRIKHLKGETFKHEISHLWMVERFPLFLLTTHFMIRPPGAKFRAVEHKIMDQLGHLSVAGMTTTATAELRQDLARIVFP